MKRYIILCYNKTMKEEIFKKVAEVRPREFSGSDIYNRYQFQIAFAADLIIKMAKNNINSLTFMDYLDDVVVVDNSGGSSAIIFYQVKSKDKNFITLNIILNNQWFEKMYYNLSQFNKNSKSILVTNTGINFDGKYVMDADPVSLADCLKNLDENDELKNKIYQSMMKTDTIEKDKIDFSKYWIVRTELTINDFERQIKGQLQEYAIAVNPKLDAESLNVIQMQLICELESKQKKVYNPIVIDIDKLIREKGYSTEDFNRLVKTTYTIQIPKSKDMYDFLKQNNMLDGTIFSNIIEFNMKYNKFIVDNINNGNIVCKLAFALLKEKINLFINVSEQNLMGKLIDELDSYDKISTTKFYMDNKIFIVGLFLYKQYEGNL